MVLQTGQKSSLIPAPEIALTINWQIFQIGVRSRATVSAATSAPFQAEG
jgi:hypothetical protein